MDPDLAVKGECGRNQRKNHCCRIMEIHGASKCEGETSGLCLNTCDYPSCITPKVPELLSKLPATV